MKNEAVLSEWLRKMEQIIPDVSKDSNLTGVRTKSSSSTGLSDLSVLDLSHVALDVARQRLGKRGEMVNWIVSDITIWSPTRDYDLWHDRAVFHFLVDPKDRAAYLDRLSRCVRPSGYAIIATFALDGPETCSGLRVIRYSPRSPGDTLGHEFALVTQRVGLHHTPSGRPQSFQFGLFRKVG